jgi:putative toxin-antitoxin system antitoxin component (TIGR02293 family)
MPPTRHVDESSNRHAADLDRFRRALAKRPSAPHSYAMLLGLRTSDWPTLLRGVEHGFSIAAFDHFQRNVGLGAEQLFDWLRIAPRTVTRRRRNGQLLPEESDRLLRAARLFGRALELFEGDRDGAVEWLTTPKRALGGASPIDVAKTELGSREVENLIGRLEHGVYS